MLCALDRPWTPFQRFYFIGIYRFYLKLTFMFIRIASLLFDKSLTCNDLFYDFSSRFSLGVQVDVLFKVNTLSVPLTSHVSLPPSFRAKETRPAVANVRCLTRSCARLIARTATEPTLFDSLIFQFFYLNILLLIRRNTF